MRTRTPLITGLLLTTILAAGSVQGQITANPIPEPIVKKGLAVEVKDVVRLPQTRGLLPANQDTNPAGYARVSYVRHSPDGRLFANDSRGFLYIVNGSNPPQLYANLKETFPRTVYDRLESGFIGFTFHPEFATNGLFYTVHAEHAPGNPAKPNFIPPGFSESEVTFHNIITEWKAANPSANTFQGTRRELLREAHIVDSLTHPMGAVEFNPTARPGDPDYGLLYTSGSDHGFSNGAGPKANNPTQTQRLDSIMTAALRIDPRPPSVTGGVKGLGDYTIPASNRFQADGDPKTLGEIYAYGFRNGHRMSWDLTDGTMFISDIGMNHIEEINIVKNGDNHGWMAREGHWENARFTRPDGGTLNQLYPQAEDIMSGQKKDAYSYPVAMYDHDEGRSVTDGFTYHGDIPQLRGKFIFGDIQNGRVFASDVAALKRADDGVPRTVAPIEEIQLYVRDANGARRDVTLQELVNQTLGAPTTRADLHIGRGRNGEIYITSRQDGMIRMLVPDNSQQRASAK
jgi:hypothetical protein